MNLKPIARATAKWSAAAIVLAAAGYGTYAGLAWLGYRKPKRATGDDIDELLDAFLPEYDVMDRHNVGVAAPAEVSLSVATEMDLEGCAVVRGIFKGRELILRSKPDYVIRPRGMLARVQSLGWQVLAERPGREIVVGCVTKPWEANPIFRPVPPDQFAAFQEPGYVKIIWTLRADPLSDGGSVFHTETRAAATDRESRKKFRRYWAFLSPGIILIRRAMVAAVKSAAELRWRNNATVFANSRRVL
jgi:hypothetical protein